MQANTVIAFSAALLIFHQPQFANAADDTEGSTKSKKESPHTIRPSLSVEQQEKYISFETASAILFYRQKDIMVSLENQIKKYKIAADIDLLEQLRRNEATGIDYNLLPIKTQKRLEYRFADLLQLGLFVVFNKKIGHFQCPIIYEKFHQKLGPRNGRGGIVFMLEDGSEILRVLTLVS
jgi:hypothetical protein